MGKRGRRRTKDWPNVGGEMDRLIRETDWAQTPLGPIHSWSSTLKTMVTFLLVNRFPQLLWWGPQLCQIYNDPYRPMLGTKHPKSMGQPAPECWREIWHVLEPLIETPFNGGPATWMEDICLEIKRHGFVEEAHFAIAYSPVPDESVKSGIGGVLATFHEISEKVVAERRIMVLRGLGNCKDETTAEQVCNCVALTLGQYSKDIPFALIYLLGPSSQYAYLAGRMGVIDSGLMDRQHVELGDQADLRTWNLEAARRSEKLEVIENLQEIFGAADVPPGPWSDPPQQAVVAPIHSNVPHHLAGFLVVGVSSRLRLDDSYLTFIELTAAQIATAISNARAYEEEKRRAEELAKLDRAKTEFFSNVSHELRTPLNSILGWAQMLQSNTLDVSATCRAVEAICTSAKNQAHIIDDLLDVTRIVTGEIVLRPQKVLLSECISAALNAVSHALGAKRIQLDVRFVKGAEGIDLYADPHKLQQILWNLLSNAVKFTPAGGRIQIQVKQTQFELCISVRDSGIGIEPEFLPLVFERFWQADSSSTRKFGGIGLGLSIARHLAELHGGYISAHSGGKGAGSTFTVVLPINPVPESHTLASKDPSLPDAAETVAGKKDFSGKKLLLIEDDLLSSEMLRIVMEQEGLEMKSASNAAQALEILAEWLPDVIISDLGLPDEDGYSLIKKIRSLPLQGSEIPAIALTGYGKDEGARALASGFNIYKSKPVDVQALVTLLNDLVK